MTKKEQAEMEELKTRLALHFYPMVEPDIDPKKVNFDLYPNRLINGWTYNIHTAEVKKSCTSYVSHNYGYWDKVNSRDAIFLYSNRKDAYKALLSQMASNFANELRKVERNMEMLEDAE